MKTRREFLKAAAALAAASASVRKGAAVARKRVLVVGAGAFGGWSALQLLRRGAEVTLVDAWGPGHSRASSGGETRVIRATYGPSRLYSQMTMDSLREWEQSESRLGRALLQRTGVLWMTGANDTYEQAAMAVLSELKVPFERLSADECRRRWPAIDFSGVSYCIFEPQAGFLYARTACEAVMQAFRREGGTYLQAHIRPGQIIPGGRLEEVRTDAGERLQADVYVFACGPWLPQVFPELKDAMRITRQEVFFFGTPAGDSQYSEEKFPTWIDHGDRFIYGIPGNQWRGFKLADDTRGPVVDPTTQDRRVSDEGVKAARAYLARRFPGLKDAPLVEGRVCQYENSADENFILDRHPRATNSWIVGGGSGHGFKHGPAVGQLVAAAVLEEQAPPSEFRLGRFARGSTSRA